MTTDLTLRRYRPADHDRVLAVHEAALRETGVYVEDAPEPDLDDVEAAYPDTGGEFLVGELDSRIVATGAFRPARGYITEFVDVTEETAEVKRMRVAPDHQRRGFGRRVCRELERRARDGGFTELVLDTMPSLTAARRLYEAEGFEQLRREQFEHDGEDFELLFYRKRLEE